MSSRLAARCQPAGIAAKAAEGRASATRTTATAVSLIECRGWRRGRTASNGLIPGRRLEDSRSAPPRPIQNGSVVSNDRELLDLLDRARRSTGAAAESGYQLGHDQPDEDGECQR